MTKSKRRKWWRVTGTGQSIYVLPLGALRRFFPLLLRFRYLEGALHYDAITAYGGSDGASARSDAPNKRRRSDAPNKRCRRARRWGLRGTPAPPFLPFFTLAPTPPPPTTI